MLSKRCSTTFLVLVWLVGLGNVSSLPIGRVCAAQNSVPDFENSGVSDHGADLVRTQDRETSTIEVPPEVLRAIYPQLSQTSQQIASEEQTYFEQSENATSLQLGSSDQDSGASRQAQFNDHLVEEMNSTTNRPPAQQSHPQSYAEHNPPPARVSGAQQDHFEVLRNSLDQTANRNSEAGSKIMSSQNAGFPSGQQNAEPHTVPSKFEARFDQQVAPASHVAPMEEMSQLEPVVDLARRDRQPLENFELSNSAESRARESKALAPNSAKTSLSELLANSNRDSNQSRPNGFDSSLLLADNLSQAKARSNRATPSLTETLQRIAMSLCLVLTVAFLVLLGAKRWWFGPKSNSQPFKNFKTNGNGLPIQILNQIRLDAKSQLYLVRANEQQVLVAVDAGGIKSVLPLQSDFGSALEQFSQPVETGARSIVQEIEEELGQPAIYTPASAPASAHGQVANQQSSSSSRPAVRTEVPIKSESSSDLELEMRRKLAELLRGSLLNQKS